MSGIASLQGRLREGGPEAILALQEVLLHLLDRLHRHPETVRVLGLLAAEHEKQGATRDADGLYALGIELLQQMIKERKAGKRCVGEAGLFGIERDDEERIRVP